MEVLKVKIELTPMDVHRDQLPYFSEARYGPMEVTIGSKDDLPQPPNVRIERYMLQEVRGLDRSLRRFLVPVDDQDIFRDLVRISNDTLHEAFIRNAEEQQIMGERRMRHRIAALSWWERLFKRF